MKISQLLGKACRRCVEKQLNKVVHQRMWVDRYYPVVPPKVWDVQVRHERSG